METGDHLTSMRLENDKKERKLGHRRVSKKGEISYKKIQTEQIITSVQLGIQQERVSLTMCQEHDLLMQDFMTQESNFFPARGSFTSPPHKYQDFKFKIFAPKSFRHFRDMYRIRADDYFESLCKKPLRELANPGASGSVFFTTEDDKFIIKTVQHKEAEFLQKLLPGYYLNLHQNSGTLLPKFYGLYCYNSNRKNIRLIVMNNILPSYVKIDEKYDLKGSRHKREANEDEKEKRIPTLKDTDFVKTHPKGIFIPADKHKLLIKTLQNDCRVLESFRIMDYSLLLGIHKVLNNEELEEGIEAFNEKGEKLRIFVGIIDILQSYRLKKKVEHALKSVLYDSDLISVHNPSFYSTRFQQFIGNVFRAKKISKQKICNTRGDTRSESISTITSGVGSMHLYGTSMEGISISSVRSSITASSSSMED